jgi:hypothetical protein
LERAPLSRVAHAPNFDELPKGWQQAHSVCGGPHGRRGGRAVATDADVAEDDLDEGLGLSVSLRGLLAWKSSETAGARRASGLAGPGEEAVQAERSWRSLGWSWKERRKDDRGKDKLDSRIKIKKYYFLE